MLQGSERQVPTWLFYGGWDGEGLEAGCKVQGLVSASSGTLRMGQDNLAAGAEFSGGPQRVATTG